jgi:23S rRNA pseudouridine1911/1915/1917 synthase
VGRAGSAWPARTSEVNDGRRTNDDRQRIADQVTHALVILHEDPHCLALVKPPGQFTQGSWAPPNEITLETAVRRHLNPGDPSAAYLGIVHRLDRPTSGLLIWAKTPKAARRLSLQFERRRVVKEYWAIVESKHYHTCLDVQEETWTDWLTHADARGVVSTAAPNTPEAREAITRVHFEADTSLPSRFRWLRLWPQTGRTHQLRAQAASRGMPILGDSLYGSTILSALPQGIALHARALSLNHPVAGDSMTLVAPLPSTWSDGGIAVPTPETSDAKMTDQNRLEC